MEFEITKIEGDLVHGLVRSNGRDLRKIAEDYFAGPNTSCPYAGGSGDLCPVESWIAKTRGEVPGGDAGDWGLIFHVRDPSGLVAGTHAIEIAESSAGIDFRLEDKDMSNSDGMFDQLVAKRMSEIRKNADAPNDTNVLRALATTQISKERPDLTEAIIKKEKLEASLPPKPKIAKAAPQEPLGPASRELDRLVKSRMGEIRKSAGPKDEKILKSMATTEICREHPGLMRQVLNEERRQEARLAFGGVV